MTISFTLGASEQFKRFPCLVLCDIYCPQDRKQAVRPPFGEMVGSVASLWACISHFEEAFVRLEILLDLTRLCCEISRVASGYPLVFQHDFVTPADC